MASLIAMIPARNLGLPLVTAGATLSEVDLGPVTSIAPFRGREAAVARSLGAAFPRPGRVERIGEARLMWVGPGRALLIGRAPPEGLGVDAAVVDLSDAQVVLLLEGTASRDVLVRLVPLDLRDAAFPEGSTARSLVNHMTATISRTGHDAYEVMAMRSMAATLVHEIATAMRGVAARA